MIGAAATAVGINMTFLMPYTLLNRGWDKTFRGLARFDLSTGMAIPYVLVTSCVVIAAAATFHAKVDEQFLSDDPAICQQSPIYAGAVKLVEDRCWNTKWGPTAGRRLTAEQQQARIASRMAAMPEAEKRVVASLVRRDAFQLSKALAPLLGEQRANFVFGVGIFGMGFSTIIILMLINGFAFCEIFDQPLGGTAARRRLPGGRRRRRAVADRLGRPGQALAGHPGFQLRHDAVADCLRHVLHDDEQPQTDGRREADGAEHAGVERADGHLRPGRRRRRLRRHPGKGRRPDRRTRRDLRSRSRTSGWWSSGFLWKARGDSQSYAHCVSRGQSADGSCGSRYGTRCEPRLTIHEGCLTTMDKLRIVDARQEAAIGRSVCLQGWIRTRRDSKGGFSFLELNDGSCLGNIQVIADGELENYESEIKRLSAGCSVSVWGEVKASGGKGQATEVLAETIQVHGWADPETYPLQKKRHTFEKLREWAHLRPRTNTFGAVMRVRNCLSQSIHRFFQEQGFLYVHTPIITASDCEGAGEMFRVTHAGSWTTRPRSDGQVDYTQDFFERPTFLTVSGQLEGGDLCDGAGQSLHVWPDVSRGKLQHLAAPGRILDDRAGNGVLRTGRQHGSGRDVPEAPVPRRAGTVR